jgi:hypothetical protein
MVRGERSVVGVRWLRAERRERGVGVGVMVGATVGMARERGAVDGWVQVVGRLWTVWLGTVVVVRVRRGAREVVRRIEIW